MTTAIDMIAAERERQKTVEGWTADHDDDHGMGEMADAAACYATTDRTPLEYRIIPGSDRSPPTSVRVPSRWPWDAEWWRPCPKDRIRELVKAGALICAEIERLQRANVSNAEISGRAENGD